MKTVYLPATIFSIIQDISDSYYTKVYKEILKEF